jgi:hypothetical protein
MTHVLRETFLGDVSKYSLNIFFRAILVFFFLL